MYTNSIFTVTGLVVAAVAAVPRAEFQRHHQHHPKRDIVWVTEYQEVVETIAVTKTVWVKPSQTQATPSSTPEVKQVQPAAYSPAPVAAPAYVAPAAQSEPAAAASIPTAPAYVAPVSSEAAAVPTSTYVPPPAPYVAPVASSSAAAAPASSSVAAPSYNSPSDSGSSSGGQSYSGDFTWFDVGMGACGFTSTSDQDVVAVSHVLFDKVSTGNPNTNPLCKKIIYLIGADGNTYPGEIVDRCPSCAEGSLDLSESFFKKVTSNGDGRVLNMKWHM
ncbi:hypothetical protein TI39_contig4156g00001 [Zymoseptoria brevis]|uniref:Riboflavin aldehyde-forming enzyme like protein n=1 Tax=Zymoseptoria brevis TaxID=1047168 RepID=A0A0F4GBQ7_9PEZI|nr:hypothetical protein TI39_contig4156g00001 [Zymoseptoria brevis]